MLVEMVKLFYCTVKKKIIINNRQGPYKVFVCRREGGHSTTIHVQHLQYINTSEKAGAAEAAPAVVRYNRKT